MNTEEMTEKLGAMLEKMAEAGIPNARQIRPEDINEAREILGSLDCKNALCVLFALLLLNDRSLRRKIKKSLEFSYIPGDPYP